MAKLCEVIHKHDDSALIFLKKVVDEEAKDRGLKIDSDYNIRPERSWMVRFLIRMKVL